MKNVSLSQKEIEQMAHDNFPHGSKRPVGSRDRTLYENMQETYINAFNAAKAMIDDPDYICTSHPFYNGVMSWADTHYEISVILERMLYHDKPPKKLSDALDQFGSLWLRSEAYDLTTRFEKKHLNRQWDGEYFDEIVLFLEEWVKS